MLHEPLLPLHANSPLRLTCTKTGPISSLGRETTAALDCRRRRTNEL